MREEEKRIRNEDATSDATLRDLEQTDGDETLEKEDKNRIAPSLIEATDEASIESISDEEERQKSSDADELM